MFTRQSRQRRAVIEAQIGQGQRILEFGPLDNPTFHTELGHDVASLDFFSREELLESIKNNPTRRSDRVGPVDHVVKSKNFAEEVEAQFDLLVANHVLEHVPDPIAWLANASSLLAPGGTVFLALPDRRYTFDFYRPETSAPNLLRASEDDLDKPTKWQILEAIYFHTKVNAQAVWAGEPVPPFSPRMSMKDARRVAEKRSESYVSTHCWVFTRESFENCIRDLRSAEVIDFEIEHIDGPVRNTNEFHVFLRKSGQAAPGN